MALTNPSFSAEVKERVELFLYFLPLWTFMTCYRVNFTFTLTYFLDSNVTELTAATSTYQSQGLLHYETISWHFLGSEDENCFRPGRGDRIYKILSTRHRNDCDVTWVVQDPLPLGQKLCMASRDFTSQHHHNPPAPPPPITVTSQGRCSLLDLANWMISKPNFP